MNPRWSSGQKRGMKMICSKCQCRVDGEDVVWLMGTAVCKKCFRKEKETYRKVVIGTMIGLGVVIAMPCVWAVFMGVMAGK